MTGGLAFFVVTFTVCFFNFDMKLTSMIGSLIIRWHDMIIDCNHQNGNRRKQKK